MYAWYICGDADAQSGGLEKIWPSIALLTGSTTTNDLQQHFRPNASDLAEN